ncbi:MAG: BMP family ABC transporter substrate-binding protein [Eubacteriales bacterium]|nr:BMP family ABC transporter substrate-binding protein [Eubacteriales bacterium]
MKKYIAILLAVVMLFSLAGCKKDKSQEMNTSEGETTVKMDDGSLKIGFILPAESGAPDTEAREDAIRKMQYEAGLNDSQIFINENVSAEACADVISEQVKEGCNLIFACGARYEEATLAAAEEHSDVQFCIEGGKTSIDSELSNVHTFNSKIFEAYYAAGVAAGMEINYLLNIGDVRPEECTIGFVAYKECPETTTCINAFYQGVKRKNSQCTVAVRYVGKRGNYDADGEEARQLVARGTCLMCTYNYTTAVGAVCAENGIPVVGCQNNMINVSPKRSMMSTYTDWSVYYIEAVNSLINGAEIAKDWCGGYKEGAVRLTQINDVHIAKGIAQELVNIEKELKNGKAKIFALDSFKINDVSLDQLVKDDDAFKKYKKYIKNGELKEQSLSSAPIFEHRIDGIQVSTDNFLHQEESEGETEE